MSLLLFVAGGAATGALFGALAAGRRRASEDVQAEAQDSAAPRSPSAEALGPASDRSETGRPPPLPADVVRPKSQGVPFAEGIARPVWPLQTRHPRRGVVSYRGVDGKVRGNWARRFAAYREGSKGKRDRSHAGIDLFGHPGDPVLAVADGMVTAVQRYHLGSWAVFVDHGDVVVMYGEVAANSWKGLGVSVGTEVRAGQPIAAVACMVRNKEGRCVSHMLHLETYVPGTRRNLRWYAGQDPPPALRDPTLLLLHAAQEPSTLAAAA